LGPPSGYTFNEGESEGQVEQDDGGVEDSLRNLAIFLLTCSAFIWLVRRKGDE